MKKLYFISFLLMSFILNGQENIFFSEYAEGSSNNKYLEIFNNSAETIDLTQYAFPNVSNAPTTVGEYEYWNTFDDGSTIEPYGIFVIAHPEAEDPILAEADMTSFVYFSNGDDGFKLVYGTEESFTILDEIGDWQGDPGAGWDVAGVTSGTKDHTLVRKSSVQNGNTWSNSAGSTAEDSEWIVYDQNTWTYLGTHEIEASTSEGCYLILAVTDSYGDSWNGGILEVYVNGALAGVFENEDVDGVPNFGEGETEIFDIFINYGDEVTFDFTSGEFCEEASFTVTDADGNVVASMEEPEGCESNAGDATFECVDPNPDPIEGSWCEDFDGEAFPAEGWASFRGENGLGEGYDWEASSTYAVSGTNSAHVRYENVDGGLAEDWLVTPMFIPDASNNHISFSHRQAYGTDYGSTYAVKVSTASQTSHGDFTDIATWTEADFEPSEFTSIEFSLADYIGVPIHVAFVMTNDDGDDWYIDDVCVQAGLSTPDNEILDMRIYPNPVDGNYVTIQSPIQGLMEVEVYTVTGRKVLQTVLTGDQLNVGSFNSGFYMVKVTINGQSKLSKLVVR